MVREKGRGLGKAGVGKGARSGWGKRLLKYSCNPFMREILFFWFIDIKNVQRWTTNRVFQPLTKPPVEKAIILCVSSLVGL